MSTYVVPSEVILSPTRVELGERCMRKHVLQDVLGVTPNDHSAPALDFGDVMHRGINWYWINNRDVVGAQQIISSGVKWPLNTTHTLPLAIKLLDVYAQEARLMPYGGDEWVIETAEVRKQMKVAFGTLSFQIDRLLRNLETNALALVDLKTASKCDKRWENQWIRSLQMQLYSACITKSYGQDLQWMIIEGLEKTKPGVHYLALPEVTKDKQWEALRQVEWVARHDSELLDRCRLEDGSIDVQWMLERALIETPFNRSECFSYNQACPFLELCDAEPNERLALLAGEYHYEAPKHLV